MRESGNIKTKHFEKLLELVRERKITIGVQRNQANKFWYNSTVIGKILNLLTYLFALLAIAILIKFGIWYGILAVVFLVVYVKSINYISAMYVRLKFFKNERLFNAAYEARLITIRDNSTSQVILFPSDWRKIINI